ncbi:hypothetical protein DFH07DRAFT_765303 [Mycena maculata]|uniref:Uncharacterized protein n=1 Tax=Mycena maculata TaxID=230809 RepID=A0AAD7KDD3_9AGAR|nr:hypothetical protein DFH07DRAFT_765303 [Mycena maculata]
MDTELVDPLNNVPGNTTLPQDKDAPAIASMLTEDTRPHSPMLTEDAHPHSPLLIDKDGAPVTPLLVDVPGSTSPPEEQDAPVLTTTLTDDTRGNDPLLIDEHGVPVNSDNVPGNPALGVPGTGAVPTEEARGIIPLLIDEHGMPVNADNDPGNSAVGAPRNGTVPAKDAPIRALGTSGNGGMLSDEAPGFPTLLSDGTPESIAPQNSSTSKRPATLEFDELLNMDAAWTPPPHPRIVKRPKEKSVRHKKGEAKRAPGKLSWVWGMKKVFFEKRKDAWLCHAEKKDSGVFYTKIAKLFVLKYGYDLGDDEDFEVDVEDPPDEAAEMVMHEILPEGEGERRSAYKKNLRTVSIALVIGKEKKADQIFLADGPMVPGRAPWTFYVSLMKEEFERRREALHRRAVYTDEKVLSDLELRGKVTHDVYEAQTAAFKEDLKLQRDKEWTAAVKGWEASLADSPTRMAEEIATNLENAAFYLQPFVDAIMERFGMVAAVLLAGPIGKRGGTIGMQSVHAGVTKGLGPVNWPEFDKLGFAEVEKSMVAFARECFSEAECRARVPRAEIVPQRVDTSKSSSAMEPVAGRSGRNLRAEGGTEKEKGAGADGGGEGEHEYEHEGEGEGGGRGEAEGDIHMEDDGDGAGSRKGSAGGSAPPVKEGPALQAQIDTLWQRDDRADWTEELGRAHAAKDGALRYEDGAQMGTTNRPTVVGTWLGRGRKWNMTMDLGTLGDEKDEESFVAVKGAQEADWEGMSRLYGRNRVLHVMATLLWWGDVVADGDNEEAVERWRLAVEDVQWALKKMLEWEGEDINREEIGKKRKRANTENGTGQNTKETSNGKSRRNDGGATDEIKCGEAKDHQREGEGQGEWKGKGKAERKGESAAKAQALQEVGGDLDVCMHLGGQDYQRERRETQ